MSPFMNPNTRCAATFGAAAVFVSLFAPAALAQEENEKKLPVLGGHNFIISAQVPEPFITTFIRNATGGGLALEVETVLTGPAGDTLVSEKGDLAFLDLGFEFQLAATDWLALRLAFEGAARVGTSLQSLLGNGVSAVYGYSLGGTFRLVEAEKVIISATADLTGNAIYEIGILRLVQDVIDEGDIPDSSGVVASGTDKAAVGGLRFAWAASRLIGVRLNGAVGVADLFRSDEETKFSFVFGAAVGFNFANTSNVPVGLLGFFKFTNFSPGASNVADEIVTTGLEIDYTGHEDFSMGLELAGSRIPIVNSDQTISTAGAKINLRYFF